MIRVVIADDVRASRALIEAVLEVEPGFEVVGHATHGEEAVALTRRLKPDLVTMDTEMPVLNGCEATLRIMTEWPTPIVVVSRQDVRSIVIALNAVKAGALAVVPKPSAPGTPEFHAHARHFITVARAMARVDVVPRVGATHVTSSRARRRGRTRARVIAVAASTGGPAALSRILSELPKGFRAPLLVVQHIAQGFVEGLAGWLDASSRLKVKVARHGEWPEPGHVYLAPDGRHLGLDGERIALCDGPAIDGFRPSANHLFESVARSYGPAALGLILTGMGRDGLQGLKALHDAGGTVVAQDKDSSVVYGMNGEAVLAGLTDEVLPVEAVSGCLMQSV